MGGLAKAAIATLLQGPIAGAAAAADQAVDLLVDWVAREERPTYESTITRVARGLKRLAHSERISADQLEQGLLGARQAILDRGPSAREIAALDLDPARVTRAVLSRAEAELGALDEPARELARTAIRTVYATLLSDPKALPKLERAFQQAAPTPPGRAPAPPRGGRAGAARRPRRGGAGGPPPPVAEGSLSPQRPAARRVRGGALLRPRGDAGRPAGMGERRPSARHPGLHRGRGHGQDAPCDRALRADGPALASRVPEPGAGRAAGRGRGLFEHAAAAFRELVPDPVGPAVPSLEEAHFDRALYVLMAALAAVQGERPRTEQELLDWALRRERGFLDQGSGASVVDSWRAIPSCSARRWRRWPAAPPIGVPRRSSSPGPP